VQIAAVSSISELNPKQICQRDGNESLRYQAYPLRIGCVSKANTSKRWKRLDGCIKRIGYVSKANTSKEWKRLNGGIKRIGCVSTVRNGSTRQTDRLLSNDDRRFSSLEACNGPVASTVLLATASGSSGGSTGFKGAGNSRNRRFGTIDYDQSIDRSNDDCFGRFEASIASTPSTVLPLPLYSSKPPLQSQSQLAEAS
jgi:hypothetical protein